MSKFIKHNNLLMKRQNQSHLDNNTERILVQWMTDTAHNRTVETVT